MDLRKLHPELLISWNFNKNNNFDINNIRSNEKVWWKCEKGHEWESTIDNRTSGKGCPYCSGRLTIEGENDLATTHPELAKEWNYEKNGDLLPNKVKSGKVWWKCEKGHEWEAYISNREKGQGCPYCSGHLTIEGENDLATTNPEFLSERNYEKNGDLLPNKIKSGAGIKVWWKCEKGHEWEAVVSSRVKNGNNCPYCSNQIVLKGYNDLVTTDPKLIKERNYEKNGKTTPDMVNRGSNKKYWRKCEKGHEREATIASRSKRGNGCPYCSNQKLLKGYNDLATTHPELAKERNYQRNGNITPDMVNAGSNKRYRRKCENGHEWQAAIASRKNGAGCARCSGNIKKTDKEFKEEIKLKSPNIIILSEYKTAKTRLKCKCKLCGNEREVVANHLQQGQGCPQCVRREQTEKQTMKQEEFESRMLKVNPNILVIGKYKTTHDRVKVRCKKCNHERNPAAWDILSGNGCPNCSHTGTSYMEQFILQSFSLIVGENSIKSRDTKTIGKELDIYIPKLKFAIEPGSWFWHKNKIEEDLIKRDMCKAKGIHLVIIYDGCKDDGYYDILKKNNIIFFKKDLGNVKGIELLKGLVIHLFSIVGLNSTINDEQWKKISNNAYLASRKSSTEEFTEKASGLNKKVEIIGEYLGTTKKIKVRCKKCGYERDVEPSHVLNGQGCPKCIGRMKTTTEFKNQLAKKNSKIKVLGNYINSKTKIEVECLMCGNKWLSKPGNLLHGYGCPECGKKKISMSKSKTVSQYSLDGKFIKKYYGVSEAHRKTGINATSIHNVCNGKTKTAGGYVRKYTE